MNNPQQGQRDVLFSGARMALREAIIEAPRSPMGISLLDRIGDSGDSSIFLDLSGPERRYIKTELVPLAEGSEIFGNGLIGNARMSLLRKLAVSSNGQRSS